MHSYICKNHLCYLAGVARLVHGRHEQLAPLPVVLDVGSEAALVAHIARVSAVLGLDDRLERVVHLHEGITSFDKHKQ